LTIIDKSFRRPSHLFNVKLHSRLKKASELKSEDYGLFFASAGHAALYDYPTAKGLSAGLVTAEVTVAAIALSITALVRIIRRPG
jgi:hypothetical protein